MAELSGGKESRCISNFSYFSFVEFVVVAAAAADDFTLNLEREPVEELDELEELAEFDDNEEIEDAEFNKLELVVL